MLEYIQEERYITGREFIDMAIITTQKIKQKIRPLKTELCQKRRVITVYYLTQLS